MSKHTYEFRNYNNKMVGGWVLCEGVFFGLLTLINRGILPLWMLSKRLLMFILEIQLQLEQSEVHAWPFVKFLNASSVVAKLHWH